VNPYGLGILVGVGGWYYWERTRDGGKFNPKTKQQKYIDSVIAERRRAKLKQEKLAGTAPSGGSVTIVRE